jgi:RES domain-containing protein
MLPEAELPAVLRAVPLITVHGPWSRAVAHRLLLGPPPGAPVGSPPQPLWPGGAVISGGRFTPPGSFETIYLASDPVTALAEVRLVFQTVGGQLTGFAAEPWVLVSIEGVLTNVLDLTNAETRRRLGTSLQELTGEWRYTHAQGEMPSTHLLAIAAYESRRVTGIRFVSAKNPAGSNLAVFSDRLSDGDVSYLEVIDAAGNLAQRLP